MKNSLSEGEKTALAFAYFLSKYKFEIKDNTQINEGDYIVVLDDPVSSLDENRLYSTSIVIRDVLVPKKNNGDWDDVNRVSSLSHNQIFLKFVGIFCVMGKRIDLIFILRTGN